MDKKRNTFYLSFRVQLLFLTAAGAFTLLMGGQLVLSLRRGQEYRLIVLALILLAGFWLMGWLWIVKPYRLLEHGMRLFLDGYFPAGDEGTAECALSPLEEQLLRQVREVLNPSQMFNLNKRQAQYLALQNQINPHFLYNTLESIRSEALMAQLDSVADMTEALATFFRYTISKVENLVSVEEELQNCETYFRIQQYRFGERLRLKIQCDAEEREELYCCRLPKLTLQPILENSIIHGTEWKVGPGNLTIRLERTGKRLLIRVSDDGVGMDEETLARLNGRLGKGGLAGSQPRTEARGGLALVNVDNRIRLLFGGEYGLHVFSMPGVGTDVEIALPIITSDWEVKNREALQ